MNDFLYPGGSALAARALKFARSVPLRLGSHASRVPAAAFVSVGLGTTPWYALNRRLGFVA